jgi:hypothetical protein
VSLAHAGRLSDDDPVALYQAGYCSAVPSRELEGFGLVVLESLACGTPAVVTDAGGLPEAVAGLVPSLVVPAGDRTTLPGRVLAAHAASFRQLTRPGSMRRPSTERCRVPPCRAIREEAALAPRSTPVVFLDIVHSDRPNVTPRTSQTARDTARRGFRRTHG